MKQILQLNIRGNVTLRRFSSDNVLLDTIRNQNLVVDSGLTFMANRLLSTPLAQEFDKISVGNGSEPTTASTIHMESSAGDRTSNEFSHIFEYASIRYKQVVEPNRILLEAVLPEGAYAEQDIVEVGLFSDKDDAYGEPSELIARTVLEPVYRFVKQDAEYVSILWNIVFG